MGYLFNTDKFTWLFLLLWCALCGAPPELFFPDFESEPRPRASCTMRNFKQSILLYKGRGLLRCFGVVDGLCMSICIELEGFYWQIVNSILLEHLVWFIRLFMKLGFTVVRSIANRLKYETLRLACSFVGFVLIL